MSGQDRYSNEFKWLDFFFLNKNTEQEVLGPTETH